MTRLHTPRRFSGFTLLELLVSAGVLALVSVIIVQVIFTTVRMSARAELLKEMKQTGSVSMETVKRMIQNAKRITSACDGTPQSTLTFSNFDGGETELRCAQDTSYGGYDVYRIASYSAALSSTEYLSSGNVTLVTNSGVAGCGADNSPDAAFYFICLPDDTNHVTVTAVFRVRQQNTVTGIFEGDAETFQSTTVTRNAN